MRSEKEERTRGTMMKWKLISDIILLIEGFFGFSCSLIYLLILIRHRSCRNSSLALLVGNASLAGLLFHLIISIQSIHMLIGKAEVNCVLRGHLIHAFIGSVYHSICLQALHRLFVVVFPSRTVLQKPKTLIIMTIIQWIFSLTFCLPKLNAYPMISDICLGPFHFRFVFIHLTIAVYLFPTILLICIYSIIFHEINKKTSSRLIKHRILQRRWRREVLILSRITIPVFIILVTGLPLATFFIQGQFTFETPEYKVRLALICATGGTALVMLANIIFTDSVRQHLSFVDKLFIRVHFKTQSNESDLTPFVGINLRKLEVIHRNSTADSQHKLVDKNLVQVE